MFKEEVVCASYCKIVRNPTLGVIANPISEPKYVHRECFDDLSGLAPVYNPHTDTFDTHPSFTIGDEPRPKSCASCVVSMCVGDYMWKMTYATLSITPSYTEVTEHHPDNYDAVYPDTYLCGACADTFVFGEA
jgi:hypothetical protein